MASLFQPKGNWSKAKTDYQILNEARPLQGMNLSRAAKQIGVGWERFARLVKKHGLYFVTRELILSDSEILCAIREYGYIESSYKLAIRLNASHDRIIRLATENKLSMVKMRKTPNKVGLQYDKNGYAVKRCSCCDQVKGAEYFREDNEKILSGLSSWCIQCMSNKYHLKRALEALPV